MPRTTAFAPDGRSLAVGSKAGKAGELTLWDVASRRPRWSATQTHPVRAVVWTPDGKTLIAAVGPSAVLIDSETGKKRGNLGRHGRFLVRSAVFTPDGKGVVTAGGDGTARLWDAQSGNLRARFSGQGGLDGALTPAEAHTLVLWGVGRTIALFDLDLRPPDAAMTRRIALLIGHLDADGYATRESASRELKSLGWIAATALRKAAKESESAEVRIRARAVLTALETEPRKLLRGHTSDLRTVCCSKDGKMLASGSEDGTVRLWDRTTGKSLAVLSR